MNTATKTSQETVPTKAHQRFPSEEEDVQSEVHFELCAQFVLMLKHLFRYDGDAHAGGDTCFYWNSEDDRYRIVPDACLIRGAGSDPRKSFKLWAEKERHPNFSIRFVLEVWSEDNKLRERHQKLRRYEELGATEFFELDSVTGDFSGFRLHTGRYEVLEPNADGRLFSVELQADIGYEGGLLRLYRNGEKVLTADEAVAQAEAARTQAEAAQAEAQLERQAKESALEEVTRLKKLLDSKQ